MNSVAEPMTSKGKYAEAFALYCQEPGEPDLLKIAKRVGVHSETLVENATRRGWAQKRGLVQAQATMLATQNRIEAAARVDALAIKEVSATFERVTRRLNEFLDVVCSLPINDDDPRIRAQQVAKGLELTNETIRGLSGLVETGRSIGLILGAKNPGSVDAGKIDFSKLTSLTLVLKQAADAAGQKTVEPVGTEAAPIDLD